MISVTLVGIMMSMVIGGMKIVLHFLDHLLFKVETKERIEQKKIPTYQIFLAAVAGFLIVSNIWILQYAIMAIGDFLLD